MCQVLLVEDNEMIQFAASDVIRGMNIRGKPLKLLSCADEYTAIEYLKTQSRLDLLLTDYKILQTPDGPEGHPGGATLIKWVLENRCNGDRPTQIILMTMNPQGFLSNHPELEKHIVEYNGVGALREKLSNGGSNGNKVIPLFKKVSDDVLTRNWMDIERVIELMLEKPKKPMPESKQIVVPSFN